MKIVRVTLGVGQHKVFYDRPFEEGKNDFENCDSALKFLSELFKQNEVLAVMHMTGGSHVTEEGKTRHDPFMGAVPAMINLRNVVMLTIENAGVYNIETPAAVEPTVEVVDE